MGYRIAMDTAHDAIAAALRKIVGESPYTRTMPPPVMAHLGMAFTGHSPGERLTAAFPALPCFANSAGSVQGGILCAALDAAFGSLAILETGAPCVSLSLNAVYHRPVPADGHPYGVEVRLTDIGETYVHLTGAVLDQNGQEAVFSNTTMKIMRAPAPAAAEGL